MAVAGDWARRSRIIGRHLRDVVMAQAEDKEEDVLGGLDSFVFVRADVSRDLMVMPAVNINASTPWLRWLPRMDKPLTSKAHLEMFLLQDPKAGELRRNWAQSLEAEGLTPRWCFWCGNGARNKAIPWCRTCCIDSCDSTVCLQYLANHRCPSELR